MYQYGLPVMPSQRRGQAIHPSMVNFMKKHTAKEFVSPDGKRRVVIFQREDGQFSFREERMVESLPEERWVHLWTPAPMCGSEEAAEQAARDAILWLRDLKRA
jgi:hypothetical protein